MSSAFAFGFVVLTEEIPDMISEIRYYTTYNFVGERITGYNKPVALVTKECADALRNVNRELLALGYRMKIYDTYRPQRAVDHFVRWAEDLDDTRMKPFFYPGVDKTVLFDEHYLARKSGHSRGSTVDLTLFDMKTGKDVDMGGPFDFFGELSHPDYTETLTETQIKNRSVLRNAMLSAGFLPSASEWWHFTLKNEPYPETYFDFPIE
ncbi:MAG: M15 family metallopeptidase [Clostridiales bacterium]|nr:M15 family metallopeptidase [Candidatus Coliplasma caballi]